MRRGMQATVLLTAGLAMGAAVWAFAGLDRMPLVDVNEREPAKGPAPEKAAGRPADVATALAPRAAEREARPDLAVLKIEVARIDAQGASVLAGRAPPGQRVSILANGREIATVRASEDGQWSVVATSAFAAGPLELVLIARPDDGGAETRSAAVHLVVPAGEARTELVAATRPIRPTVSVERGSRPVAAPTPEDGQALARLQALVEQTRTSAAQPPAVATAPVPVPITFQTGDAVMTPFGLKAATLLAEYLRLTRPRQIVLSGHADSRGPDNYNMALSRRRLVAIEHFLRREGYAGKLDLLPMGEREPYQGIDRARFAKEEAWQADRRVELRMTQ